MTLGRGAAVAFLALLMLALSRTGASTQANDECTERQLQGNMYGDGKAQEAVYQCASDAVKKILETKRTDDPTDPANPYFRFEGILLRMAFHDAGTWNCSLGEGGANGSLRFPKEYEHRKNRGLSIGAKAFVGEWEAMTAAGCGITFADLTQIAGAEACFYTGLPRFRVPIGRKDASGPDLSTIDQLPRGDFNIDQLKHLFLGNGYTVRDLVALSGAHTIGIARTVAKFGAMDGTPDVFDNVYYQDLVKDGCQIRDNITGNNFCSDSALLDNIDSAKLVVAYRAFPRLFYRDFVNSYIKMGKMGVNADAPISHV